MVEPFEEFGFGVRPKGAENRTEPNFPRFSPSLDHDLVTVKVAICLVSGQGVDEVDGVE